MRGGCRESFGSERRKRRERWQRDAGAGRERWERRERAEQEAGDSFVLRERSEHHRKHGINQQCFSITFFCSMYEGDQLQRSHRNQISSPARTKSHTSKHLIFPLMMINKRKSLDQRCNFCFPCNKGLMIVEVWKLQMGYSSCHNKAAFDRFGRESLKIRVRPTMMGKTK